MTWLQRCCRLSVSLIRLRTKSHSSSLDMTSQMPSHAKITNSSPAVRTSANTSGSGETSCSHGPLPATFLYSKSPSARDTASEPFTRWIMTLPPAFWMRSFSIGLIGLWSSVRNDTRLSLESTARESPQFPKKMCVGEMTAHTAVEPLLSSPLTTSGEARILSSSDRKPSVIPFLILSRDASCPSPPDSSFPLMPTLKNSFDIIASSSWTEQHADTRAPAWPSKIAKNDQFFRWSTGNPITALCASSISTRQPCMLLRPKRSPLPLPDSLCFSVFGLSRNAPILSVISTPLAVPFSSSTNVPYGKNKNTELVFCQIAVLGQYV